MKRLRKVPYIDQTERWVCGCESVSAVMLLQYWGIPVQPDAFIHGYLPRAAAVKKAGRMYAADPHDFYIGDPREASGWGCYAPCICRALENVLDDYGKTEQFAVENATGKTAAELAETYLSAGMPVIFWATLDFGPCRETAHWTLPDGGDFAWVNGEHCLLLVGCDEENYWFNDPWHNHGCCAYPKALVEQRQREQRMYAGLLVPKNRG